jgi:N-acetylglucosaminyl-diphospho-decaprenol L-rhamnosyltransferase
VVTQDRQHDLGVVVVTYNSADVVGALLDSLPAALGELRADVVVVDNGSADDTVARLQRRGDCRVIPATNRGYSAGINTGVREAPGLPAYLILNPDVRLRPGSVPPLLAALAVPATGITAPQMRTASGELDLSLRREPTLPRALGLTRTRLPLLSEYVYEPEAYAREHEVDWAVGAALCFSRECWEILGGWDESFFLYSEETDFCLRARDAGYATRYVPSSVVVHLGGASGRTEATQAMQILNRVRLYRRRRGATRAWLYWALAVLSELSHVVRGRREARFVVRALLRPSARPPAVGCSTTLLPA